MKLQAMIVSMTTSFRTRRPCWPPSVVLGKRSIRRLILPLLMLVALQPAFSDDEKMMAVTERDGTAYVAGSELARQAGIAVKGLPGSSAVVACLDDRCAQLKGSQREGEEIWVSTSELSQALGLAARFSADRRLVGFSPAAQTPAPADSITRVGQLAPNFRVTRLDGTAVSLADFRGKRVLIQSWASW